MFIGDHCFDTDNGKTDSRNGGCVYREKHDCDFGYYNENQATGFNANEMCCGCGGGTGQDTFQCHINT